MNTVSLNPLDKFNMDFPAEPIGGGNPYYRCVSCKRSVPEINGNPRRHESWCDWRKSLTRNAALTQDRIDRGTDGA